MSKEAHEDELNWIAHCRNRAFAFELAERRSRMRQEENHVQEGPVLRCEGCDEDAGELHRVPCYEGGLPNGRWIWLCGDCCDDLEAVDAVARADAS